MTLQERIEQLEPRERFLLNVLLGVVGIAVVVVIPLWLFVTAQGQRAHNREVRDAIDSIFASRPLLAKAELARATVEARYQRKAPELAGFLETQGKKQSIEILESQSRPKVPHGKDFEERSERISLRKVDMHSLAKFMEGIAQSGYPVSITEMNLRKRSADSYDVTMVVSAFDQKPKAPKKGEEAKGQEGGESEGALESEQSDEEEEE